MRVWDFKRHFFVFFISTKFMIREAKKIFFFFLNLKVLWKNVWVVSLYTHFKGLYFLRFLK